ncbi:MAG: M24 family metallopeptidase [Holosporaceae bacterium]|nr:MAG: M24 family metallopeptidase [Holosporaceae bacterium]
MARQFLWKEGHDYAHATGHGVGQYANVHEGPQNISPRATTVALKEGMVLSNEPGCYIEGKFGIRIENLMYVTHTGRTDSFSRKILKFNTITFCPIDRSCIDIALLTNEEKEWIDAYHNTTWEKLSHLVDARTKRVA